MTEKIKKNINFNKCILAYVFAENILLSLKILNTIKESLIDEKETINNAIIFKEKYTNNKTVTKNTEMKFRFATAL